MPAQQAAGDEHEQHQRSHAEAETKRARAAWLLVGGHMEVQANRATTFLGRVDRVRTCSRLTCRTRSVNSDRSRFTPRRRRGFRPGPRRFAARRVRLHRDYARAPSIGMPTGRTGAASIPRRSRWDHGREAWRLRARSLRGVRFHSCSTSTGFPSAGASSCTPPESVSTKAARFIAETNGPYSIGSHRRTRGRPAMKSGTALLTAGLG